MLLALNTAIALTNSEESNRMNRKTILIAG